MAVNSNNTIINGVSVQESTTYGTNAPTSTIGNITGDTYYVTPLGTQADADNATEQYRFDGFKWVKTPGKATSNIKPSLTPVLNLLTAPPSTPNDQDSYIVKATATGLWTGKEGDITTWDAASSSWVFKSPTNGDKTTVTTGANAGIWQYSSTTDSWSIVSQGITIPTPSLSVAAGNIKFPSVPTMLFGYRADTPVGVIQNRSIWTWGDDTNLNAGDLSTMQSLPKQTSVSYHNLVDGSYTKLANNFPEFVDFAWTNDLGLAIDSEGKLWAQGGVVLGSGLTTSPTGTTAVSIVPNYAWYYVGFFGTITDKIAKVYLPTYISSSNFGMVITQSGDGYVTGSNANGQLGFGDTTSRNNWVKYPINNLKYAILGQNYIISVRANGDVYFSGYDGGNFTGTGVANKTAPVLITTGAATYEKSVIAAPSNTATTIWVVKADGKLFAGGNNANGQQGRGNTTAVVGCTQVAGVTNAKFISANTQDNQAISLVKTDNSISFAGYNKDGKQGYTVNTAAGNNTSFVSPTGTFQGIVADVLQGNSTTVIRTADGGIWVAGNSNFTGDGRGTTGVWADHNKFKLLALPNPVVGMFGIVENANIWDGYLMLTNIGSIYGFGSPMITKYNASATRGFSPIRIPMWGDTGVSTVANLPMAADVVGSVSAVTASTVSDIVDGGQNQTVTFKVNYTGGIFGLVNLTGSTVTGADITQVSLTTTSTVITGASGTFDVSFVINAADISALVPPNTQAQNYLLTLEIN